MKTKDDIIKIIFQSIDEVNEQNDLSIVKDLSTRLFGGDSNIDSLGLINLLVSVEENINNECNTSISIADERAMSQHNSPFKSIETLVDYILILINE